MSKKNIENTTYICEYYKNYPYRLIAYLYGKINHEDGDESFLPKDNPEIIDDCDMFSAYPKGKREILENINKIKEKYMLDNIFCGKIANCKALQYMIAYGIHDWKVVDLQRAQDDFYFILDSGTSFFTDNREDKTLYKLTFVGASVCRNKPLLPKLVYFCDRQEFNVTESGQIFSKVTLQTHSGKCAESVIEILSNDIRFSPEDGKHCL